MRSLNHGVSWEALNDTLLLRNPNIGIVIDSDDNVYLPTN